jgi:hypothetical protein
MNSPLFFFFIVGPKVFLYNLLFLLFVFQLTSIFAKITIVYYHLLLEHLLLLRNFLLRIVRNPIAFNSGYSAAIR